MMISSSDELLRDGADPAVIIDQLRVIRGKRLALQDVSVRVACGTITEPEAMIWEPTMQRISVVLPDPTIYNDLRVIDNIRYFAELCGVDRQAADEVIEAVDLRDHRTARCANLSGGQRARVSLACALVGRPDLLVLDEPTIGLDPVLRVELWDRFTALARRGTTLLVSSHVMDEADRCGDLLLLRQGQLLAHTTPHRLRKETGCTSLEEAFLSIVRRTTTVPAAG